MHLPDRVISIVVLNDKTVMKELFGYAGSRALIYCVDFNRIIDTAKYMKINIEIEELVSFITGSIDVILVSQTAVIAAKSLGIDSLFTNGIHRTNINDVFRILGLPEKYCFPLIALVFGYAKRNSQDEKGRLSKGIIHYNKYDKLNDSDYEEIIKEYDNHNPPIGLINNWEKIGFDHYLEWFYTKWHHKIPDEKVLEIKERLIKSGFLK